MAKKKTENLEMETVIPEIENRENTSIKEMTKTAAIPEGVSIQAGEMPKAKRGNGGKRGSKYDFLLNLGNSFASFPAQDQKKAATLRTTLFNWAKKSGRKLTTSYDQESGFVHVALKN
jgi:hypothetical protein